jgi:uncharacterized cupredoxin-like copper-binding protein
MRLGVHRCGWPGGLATAALVCAAISGCGDSHPKAASGRTFAVTEHDFHIEAPAKLASGVYTFDVSNHGVTDHELIVASTPDGSLPLRPDGLTIDEEAIESRKSGALEPAGPGARRLTLHLTAGRYVFFCNMEGHYMAGMHAEVTVQ